ncbi:MAG: alanine dehydrogenase [Bacteroidetes bacterium]|nr:MAG: alanine dehydrogenase [Bacteroidota bacterium]
MSNEKLQIEIRRLTQTTVFYHPAESPLPIQQRSQNLFIGLPKETSMRENRIALTPESVKQLVINGHEIWVESGAGLPAKYSDMEYNEAGAKIVYDPKEVFSADIILKIAPPTLEEINFMKYRSTLISALQLANLSASYFKAINSKRITAIAFEFFQDKVGGLPFVRAMSEIAGSTVMLIAAEYLSSVHDGSGLILGGITGVPPTNVVILGAGTVAEYAARAAIGLGANVKVFDNHLYKLRRLKHSLNYPNLFTCPLDSYTLQDALKTAHVVIGAIRAENNGRTPCVVSEEMVSQMQSDSVIIDVSIDNGGCFETSHLTTHEHPIFKLYDVIHYCVPNIPSRVARTATAAISNIFMPTIRRIAENGGVDDMIFASRGFARGVYTYKGEVTNESIGKRYGLKFKDLELIVAARF